MPQIRAAFARSPLEMTKQLNNAIRLSILDVQSQSKINTPVDTGYLRSSHQTAFRSLYGEIVPKANYAIYVHQGTYKMKSRPFLLRAMQTKEQAIQKNFTGAVQNVLDKIAKESG